MYASILLLVVGVTFAAAQRSEMEIRQEKNDEINSAIADIQSFKADLEAYRSAAEAVANSAYDFDSVRSDLKELKKDWTNNVHPDDLRDTFTQVIADIRPLQATYQSHVTAAERDMERLADACAELDVYITALQNALSVITGCDEGLTDYHEVDGTCFYVAPNADITWEDARADCQSRGMDLASILNAGQQATVVSLLNAHGVRHGGFFRYWIGGHQFGNNNNQWYWAHDASDLTAFSTYSNWSNGEPNNSGEMCAMMWTGNGWNDGHCHNPANMRYFCQHF